MAKNDQALRAARDNLIDQLGFGYTYPVTDVDILDERLKVPNDATANIPIDPSQLSVNYRLYDLADKPVKVKKKTFNLKGDGDTANLQTPAIIADVSFKILASKTFSPRSSGDGSLAAPEGLQTYLNQTAEVRVGLNSTLKTTFVDGLPLLDSAQAHLYNFGSTTEIQVDHSQEQVNYQVVVPADTSVNKTSTELVVSEGVVGLGDKNFIRLNSTAFNEDSLLRVRATRVFDDQRENESELLDTVLYLNTQATPNLTVLTTGSAKAKTSAISVPFNSAGNLRIEASQASVRYRVLAHTVIDEEYYFANAAAKATGEQVSSGFIEHDEQLLVNVPDYSRIISTGAVDSPFSAVSDDLPFGFAPISDYTAGNGEALNIALPAITQDTLYVVQTEKKHAWADANNRQYSEESYGFLKQTTTLLVEPNIQTGLHLRLTLNTANIAEAKPNYQALDISDGNTGMLYILSLNEDSRRKAKFSGDFNAYFHDWPDAGAHPDTENMADRGLNSLRIGHDLVLADSELPRELYYQDLSVPLKLKLAINTRWGVSKVPALLLANTSLPQPSFLELKAAKTTAKVQIKVTPSQSGVSYQLWINNEPANEVRSGNGRNMILSITDEALANTPAPELEALGIFVCETHDLGDNVTLVIDQPLAFDVAQPEPELVTEETVPEAVPETEVEPVVETNAETTVETAPDSSPPADTGAG
ncbi:MAG: hypothetical protein COA42_17380 [Alteromonadaceae bacterium]|nr:MAG: hypothetical protein COA42_17380 [Alteromonadaceae bacterium]